jgi:DNA-directed RNA polymerase specialized sigma subunit
VGDSSEPRPSDGVERGREVEQRGGDSLEDAARDSQEVARAGLREELGREPNDEEIDEWLREHTESY